MQYGMLLPQMFYNIAREIFFAAEHGLVGFFCYDSRSGQGVCTVIVLLATGVRRRVNDYGFESFVLGFSFDSALTQSVYHRSAEIDWSSVCTFP